nr:LytTR family DNA-binding domain-containing protein [Sphingobacterium bovistauri]
MQNLDKSSATAVASRLALPTAEGIYFVKKMDILKVEAMSNYSVFHIANTKSKIIVSRTLKEYETTLSDGDFMRVNRSSIINLNYVVRYKKGDGGTIELLDGSEIEVSPAKKSALIEKLFNY